MYCLWSTKFGAVLIHGTVLLLGVFVKASSASFKDSSEGRAEPQNQSEEVAQWWGEWSSWSTCSRTCGGGVRSQERHCLQQRLIAMQNVNTSICVGSSKQYQLCPNQPCPSNRISFKQQQCSSFNAKAFGRKHYVWVPLYPDDYTSISNKPCDLQCTTTTGERQLLVPAQDGTYCRDGIYQGVCIEGQCQMVGCDGKLYSSKTVDKCGVCGGNGGSCYRVSGTYRKGITQLGYVLITNIPAGATDIQIIERRKTENILALSDEAGHFFFNGNTVIDNPRNFRVAGTVFKYRRPANLVSDGFEYIIAQGPTNQGLNVMYYNLNGKMPHITYEYTVPRFPEPRTAPPLVTAPEAAHKSGVVALPPHEPSGIDRDLNDTSVELSYKDNEIEGGEEYKFDNRTTPLATDEGPGALLDSVEHLVWELQAPLNLTDLPGVLVFRPLNEVFQNSVRNKLEDHEGPADYGAEDSNLIDGTSTNQNATHRSRPLNRGAFLGLLSKHAGLRRPCKNSSALDGPCPDPDSPEAQRNSSASLDNSLSVELLPGGLTSDHRTAPQDSAPYGLLVEPEHQPNGSSPQQANLLRLHQVEPAQTPNTESSNEFEVGSLDHDISLADMYRWKELRVAREGSPEGDGNRYSTVHIVNTGISTSYAMCVRYDGSEVDESLCDALTRPEPTHEFCTGKECPRVFGPVWRPGVRSREVRCSMETRLCNESTRPLSEKECEGPPCDRRWTVSDWGPCSGPCGEGRMTRYVVCKNSDGSVISDGQCDLDLKPLAVYPCGDKNCPAHWVEQEWEQCNATCGRGVKTRQVVCAGLENGVFKEFPEQACDPALRPEESAACFERPCSKWFTTSWSQCSKTCGSGVRVREVKCYQGEEVGHSCDSALKPEARQTCEVQACPTEAPADDVCQDKATANCALVLKVKLCTHWYYRKACCLSCKSKAQ